MPSITLIIRRWQLHLECPNQRREHGAWDFCRAR